MPKGDAVSRLHPGAGSWWTNTLLPRPPVEQLGVIVYTTSGGVPGGRTSVAHHGKLLITHTELASHPCYFPTCVSWNLPPNKLLAFPSLSQSLPVEQLSLRQWEAQTL